MKILSLVVMSIISTALIVSSPAMANDTNMKWRCILAKPISNSKNADQPSHILKCDRTSEAGIPVVSITSAVGDERVTPDAVMAWRSVAFSGAGMVSQDYSGDRPATCTAVANSAGNTTGVTVLKEWICE